jgi:hypothetical protein
VFAAAAAAAQLSRRRPEDCSTALRNRLHDWYFIEPRHAELRTAARALGWPRRVVVEDACGAASAVDAAARCALNKAYEHLTDPTAYVQLERMLVRWGLTFPPEEDTYA